MYHIAVPPLIDTDRHQLYSARARSVKALSYVALESSKEILADLRIGLSFDEPEVKERLAKALDFVALANPKRLRPQLSDFDEHLANENKLIRYHFKTAFVTLGCVYHLAR